ncbi:MAG: hydroxylamine reductase [Nanobdellota archaeon]
MFCNQCEETINGKGCTVAGVCGKNEKVANLQDELIEVVKQISKKGSGSEEESVFIMRALFSTITNVNFDEKYFYDKIEEGKKYIDNSHNNVKEIDENKDIKSLKEILLYGLKGMSAYLDHAYILGYKDENIFKFLRKGLSSIVDSDDSDELTSLVLECGDFGVKTMALLDKANTETYGNPEPTKVNIGVGKNPGILISGHDLKDMEELLEQTEGTDIDVYTHGEMLPANYYPAFKKYPHLKGNYGGSWWKQNEEFDKFNGPILMTTNCLVPPKESYKDRVYVTGLVGYEGLKKIPYINEKKDFSEIIAHAKQCKSPDTIENGIITGGFAHNSALSISDKIVEAIKSGKIKNFVVMGGCDGRHKERDYYTEFAKKLPEDSVILTAGCAKYRYNKLDLGEIDGIPRVLDAGQCNDCYSLVIIAQKLAEAFEMKDINDLPISYNIAWYEQKAVVVLLSLLSLGVKNIRLGPELPAFISDNVLNILVEKFNIAPISDVDIDIKKLIS